MTLVAVVAVKLHKYIVSEEGQTEWRLYVRGNEFYTSKGMNSKRQADWIYLTKVSVLYSAFRYVRSALQNTTQVLYPYKYKTGFINKWLYSWYKHSYTAILWYKNSLLCFSTYFFVVSFFICNFAAHIRK